MEHTLGTNAYVGLMYLYSITTNDDVHVANESQLTPYNYGMATMMDTDTYTHTQRHFKWHDQYD